MFSKGKRVIDPALLNMRSFPLLIGTNYTLKGSQTQDTSF